MNNFLIKESANGFTPVDVAASLLTERKMFLTESVNVESCRILLQQLIYFKEEDPEGEVVLYINSPGGAVYAGLAVYDVMSRMNVKTVCIGEAASMGTIFFLAGEKRLMLPHSRVMIHDPSWNGGSLAGLKPHELRHTAETLEITKEKICTIIADRTGHDISEIKEITKEDTYYNAKEALDFGLATGIIENINDL